MNINELYVKQIKDSLAKGNATVLVGAGFSKNAERIDRSNTKMPDWFSLADTFCKTLGLDEKDKQYADPLTLAQKIEDVYGRPFLDDMLKTLMADEQYLPSDLHKNLLRLPWTDIFTTNYDTLLERACKDIIEHRYQIIVNQSDLINSSGTTRIIKLHGSFPSNGPFIITEEDYRTYPYDHAPFVNTVQQSLLENTFILIGFSGTDPNFLKWIGWIHDNLRLKNSPKIFMISYKGEPMINTKMLSVKNIEVITLNSIDKYKSDDYTSSLNKFLLDLIDSVSKLKNNRILWPNNTILYNENDENNGEQLLKVLESTHKAYPGWIVTKFERRRNIAYILSRIERFLATAQEKTKDELSICYEYCWFNSKIGRPLFQNTILNIEKILKRNKEHSNEKQYLEIQLYLLYSYRIQGLEDRWDALYKELSGKNKEDISVPLVYENAMNLIYTLQWQKLEEAVNLINVDNRREKWVLKKCSLLAMIGHYEEAENLLENCLFYIRRIMLQNKDGKENTKYISIENCMVLLYNYIKQARNRNSKENERVQSDEDYKNDFILHLENEKFISNLSDNYVFMPRERNFFPFDIGGLTYSQNLGEDSNALIAYEFISFRELTGHPFQIGNVTNKAGIIGTILRIRHYDFKLPLILSLLTTDIKIVDSSLDRLQICMIKSADIDFLCNRCIALLRFSMNYYIGRKHINYYDTNLLEYPLKTMPEILSRFCVKCSKNMFNELVDLLIDIYKYQYKNALSNIDNLVRRVIQCMPITAIYDNMDKFWNFELMSEKLVSINRAFPNPFSYLYERLLKSKDFSSLSMNETHIKLYDELLKQAETPQYHTTALSRAAFIYKIYKIPEEQKNKFKSVLWNKENLNSYGLPDIGNFYCVTADQFPHDEETTEIMDRVERFIVDEFKNIIDKGEITNYHDLFSTTRLLIKRIEITENKAKKAIKIALSLCNLFDQFIKDLFGAKEAKNNMFCIDELIGVIILRSGLATIEKSYHSEDIEAIISILDKNKIPHALLTWCTTDNDRDNEIMRLMFKGDSNFAHNANTTIYVLTEQGIPISEELKVCLIDSVYTTMSYRVNTFALGLEYLVDSDLLTESQYKRISESLPKFIKLTELKEIDNEEAVSRKLAMRKVASMLAYTLCELYRKKSRAVPEGILCWQEIAKSPEEFAEIRLCWE